VDPDLKKDVCASVQAAIVEVLVAKTMNCARRLSVSCVTASGGVCCNESFRAALVAAAQREGKRVRFAEKKLCTDNAAMIGILGERKWRRKAGVTRLDSEIRPGWKLSCEGTD
jgi:N6-L-threonylcarbamoyladenine synthase